MYTAILAGVIIPLFCQCALPFPRRSVRKFVRLLCSRISRFYETCVRSFREAVTGTRHGILWICTPNSCHYSCEYMFTDHTRNFNRIGWVCFCATTSAALESSARFTTRHASAFQPLSGMSALYFAIDTCRFCKHTFVRYRIATILSLLFVNRFLFSLPASVQFAESLYRHLGRCKTLKQFAARFARFIVRVFIFRFADTR